MWNWETVCTFGQYWKNTFLKYFEDEVAAVLCSGSSGNLSQKCSDTHEKTTELIEEIG